MQNGRTLVLTCTILCFAYRLIRIRLLLWEVLFLFCLVQYYLPFSYLFTCQLRTCRMCVMWWECKKTEAKYLDNIQTKVFRVFLLAIHSHLYSFALRVIFLQTQATSYSFYSSVTVCTLYSTLKRRKMENLVENHSPFPMVLRNPYRNLKSENSEDYVQKPQ